MQSFIMLWIVEDLAKALVIVISFYKQSHMQGSVCALAHDVKQLQTLHRHTFKAVYCCVYVKYVSESSTATSCVFNTLSVYLFNFG